MSDDTREVIESLDDDEILDDQVDIEEAEPAEKLSKSNVRRRIEDYFEERRILDSIDYVIDKNYKSELDDIYHVDSIPINEPFFE